MLLFSESVYLRGELAWVIKSEQNFICIPSAAFVRSLSATGYFSLRFSQKVSWVGNKFAYLLPDLGFGLFIADRLGGI